MPVRAVLLALVVSCLFAPGAVAAPVHPDSDPFYAAPPVELETIEPGTILRSRQVTVNGLFVPIPSTAWQLLYRSTDSKGRAIVAVSTVLVPLTPYPAGERPLVSYQVAIDSLGSQCNPSYTLQTGMQKELVAIAPVLEAGWAVVVPDFEGPRNAYTAGLVSARTTLDGIRAAKAFSPAGLSGSPVGLWGYSGGGQATAWAAEQAPVYAPEIEIAGVAAGGVPPDLEQVARQIDGGPFAGIYFAATVGLSREFPEVDLDAYLNASGRAMRNKIGKECAETLVFGYPGQTMAEHTNVGDFLAVPAVRKVIEANRLGKVMPTAPLYVYHSMFDELIPVAGPDALVDLYCTKGVELIYNRDVAGEHIAYAFTGAPAAIGFLEARFNGAPMVSNCDGRVKPPARKRGRKAKRARTGKRKLALAQRRSARR